MLGALMIAMIGVSCFAPMGWDHSPTIQRRTMTSMVLGGVLMAVYQDWWLLAAWTVACVNALVRPMPAMHLTRINTILLFYAAYAVLKPLVQPEHIYAVLIALAVMVPMARLFEHRMWQWQQNHEDGMAVLSIAASLGLAWAGSLYWLLLAVPSVLVMWFAMRPDSQLGQAIPWLWHVALVWIALVDWRFALGLVLIEAVLLGYVAWQLRLTARGIDGGRVRMWVILLNAGWWKHGWRGILFGQGWNSWANWADSFSMLEWKKSGKDLKDYAKDGMFWSHPHSEYVHLLFEHGLIGLGALLAFMASLALHAASGPLASQALLFPAVAMASIALTHFCWTFPTEKEWGHMGFSVISLILAILL